MDEMLGAIVHAVVVVIVTAVAESAVGSLPSGEANRAAAGDEEAAAIKTEGSGQRLGIETDAYNLPDWEDDSQGFHRCLDSLFRHTSPTVLLPGEPALFFATQQYLLGRGLVVPRDVSLISLDDHPAFEWFKPEVSRIHNDTRRWVPRVVQWADNVANGREDRRETHIRYFLRPGM